MSYHLNLGPGLPVTSGEVVLRSASMWCSPLPIAVLAPYLTHHWEHVGNSGFPQCKQQVLGNRIPSLSLMLCHHFYSHCGYFLLAENNLPPISIWSSKIRNETQGTSLVVQWLRICLPTQGTWIWSLVWEDPTCCWAAKCLCCNYWKSVAKIKMLQDSMKIQCVTTKPGCSQLNK